MVAKILFTKSPSGDLGVKRLKRTAGLQNPKITDIRFQISILKSFSDYSANVSADDRFN